MLEIGRSFGRYGLRAALSLAVIVLVFAWLDKPADGDVYIKRVETELLGQARLEYTVLGGKPFDLSLNGQRVRSLLINTDKSPMEAVSLLYNAAAKTSTSSSRELFGITGNDEAAYFMDLFPEGFDNDSGKGLLSGRFMTGTKLPSYAVAAHRDAYGSGSVVNIMILGPETDVMKLVGDGTSFTMEMHEGDLTYSSLESRIERSANLNSLASEEIARGREDGLTVEIDEVFDGGRSLFMSARALQRDVQLIEAENGVQVLVQNRYAWGRK